MRITASFFPLVIFFAMAFYSADAQSRRQPARRTYQTPDHSFVVGIAPLSLLTKSGKVNVRGEWVYADNKSLSLIVGIPRPTKAPGWLEDAFVLDEEGTAENRYRSFGLTLENRFYLGGNAPHGFYLAPYVRYNRFWMTRTTVNPENGYETVFTGAIGGAGIGGSAGTQIRLGENLTLDFTFAGIDFKWLSGTLKYRTNDPANDLVALRDQVAEKLEEIPIIGDALANRIKAEGDEIRVRTPGWLLPAYRTNITLSYKF